MQDYEFAAPPPSRPPRFKAVPLRFILPNLVTLAALVLGLSAIRAAIEGKFENATLMIVVAALLDGLDGRIARALKATSRFGAELDSLADFVDFGVAPALILYLWSLHEVKNFGWFAALMFATAAALRLARFNVSIEDPNRPAWAASFFVGMPAPAGACVALLPLYVHYAWVDFDAASLAPFHVVYLLIIAGLMVSTIPHYSGKRIGRVPREYFVPLLMLFVGVGALLFIYPMPTLAILCCIYLGAIPFSVRRYAQLRDSQTPPAPPQP